MRGTMECWGVRNVLDLHADGRLAPKAERRVELHLSRCAACRALAAEAAPLRAAPAPRVPEGLAASILKGLEEQSPAPALGARDLWSLSPVQALALAAVALIVGAQALPGLPSQRAADGEAFSEPLQ